MKDLWNLFYLEHYKIKCQRSVCFSVMCVCLLWQFSIRKRINPPPQRCPYYMCTINQYKAPCFGEREIEREREREREIIKQKYRFYTQMHVSIYIYHITITIYVFPDLHMIFLCFIFHRKTWQINEQHTGTWETDFLIEIKTSSLINIEPSQAPNYFEGHQHIQRKYIYPPTSTNRTNEGGMLIRLVKIKQPKLRNW